MDTITLQESVRKVRMACWSTSYAPSALIVDAAIELDFAPPAGLTPR